MKFSRKKKIILTLNIFIISLISYLALTSPFQKRNVASTDENKAPRESVLDSISLSWNETENGLLFKVSDQNGDICQKWTSVDIVFRAEGIAYSGEVDRVTQTTSCEEGAFRQTWSPNLTQIEGENFQKTGFFTEEPPQWVMEQIVFDGSAGTQVLSFEEIQQQYGRVPRLTPQ